MNHLDKLIPLAVLGIAAAFLVILIRRVAREKEAAPRVEVTTTPTVEVPAVVIRVEPVVTVVAEPVADVELVVPPPVIVQADARPKRRSTKVMPTPVLVKPMPRQTPIQTVLGLLKEKDSLAAAFVLHEILGRPVSMRHKSNHENTKA
jgi:hypothetical protein